MHHEILGNQPPEHIGVVQVLVMRAHKGMQFILHALQLVDGADGNAGSITQNQNL